MRARTFIKETRAKIKELRPIEKAAFYSFLLMELTLILSWGLIEYREILSIASLLLLIITGIFLGIVFKDNPGKASLTLVSLLAVVGFSEWQIQDPEKINGIAFTGHSLSIGAFVAATQRLLLADSDVESAAARSRIYNTALLLGVIEVLYLVLTISNNTLLGFQLGVLGVATAVFAVSFLNTLHDNRSRL